MSFPGPQTRYRQSARGSKRKDVFPDKDEASVSDIARPPVGDSVSSAHSTMDPYLTEGILILWTCWKSLHDITGLKLCVKQKLKDWIILRPRQWETVCPFVSILSMAQEPKDDESAGLSEKTVEDSLSVLALGSAYNHHLNAMLDQEVKYIQKLPDNDSSLEKLKKSLKNLTTIVDKIMDYYSLKNLGFASSALPPLYELTKVKEEIGDLKSIMKDEEVFVFSVEHDHPLQTTEENIMCDILGMREDFGNYLYELDSLTRNHQTDFYFLEKFIETRENVLYADGAIDQTPGKNGLLKNLEKLGFTTERASRICETIPDNFIDLQSPSFWALRYLDQVNSRHPLFSSAPKYPYQEGNTDNFFIQNVPNKGRSEPVTSSAHGISEWPINILNVHRLERHEIKAKISDKMREMDEAGECKLFYHGATHESAKSILEDGIKLRCGKLKQDFSSGNGFYVSEKYTNAEKWSRVGRGGKPQAVVVFKVPQSLLSDENGKDLAPDSSGSSKNEWEEIIKECRQDYPHASIKERLSMISFIRGPMCSNPRQVKMGNKQPKGFTSGNMQLCIRGEELAREFGSFENICCAIFYEIPDEHQGRPEN